MQSVNRLCLKYFVLLSVIIQAASAAPIKLLTESPSQGSLIIGQLLKPGTVYYGKQPLAVDPEGYFVFGVGRDAPSEVALTWQGEGAQQVLAIPILQRQWRIERIDGLPPAKVNPRSKETLARIRAESTLVRQARSKASKLEHFKMPFILPAEGRISGVYGSQRVLNGEPKRPHYGLDVANKIGTPIIAPAHGVVSLVHQNMFYSGGTIIIDHGYGVSSTYIHLDSIHVEAGQSVSQGELIGTIGRSGRATGPHLDWRLNWLQTRLDPALLLQKNPVDG